MSVKRDIPVEVLKARNSRPAGASESKSMISRWISSGAGALAAAAAWAKAAAGGGLEMGTKPRFRSTHLRLTCMADLPLMMRSDGMPERRANRARLQVQPEGGNEKAGKHLGARQCLCEN